MSDDKNTGNDPGQLLGADLGGATDWARFAGLALMADIHRAKADNAKLEAARLAFKHGGSGATSGVLARAAERRRQAEQMVSEARELHRRLADDLEKRFDGLDVKELQKDDDVRGVVLARTLFERLRTVADEDRRDKEKNGRDGTKDEEEQRRREEEQRKREEEQRKREEAERKRQEEERRKGRVIVTGRTVDPNRTGVPAIRVNAMGPDNNRLGAAVSGSDGSFKIEIALDAAMQARLAPNGLLLLELVAMTQQGAAVGQGKAQARLGGDVAVDILVRPVPVVRPTRPTG